MYDHNYQSWMYSIPDRGIRNQNEENTLRITGEGSLSVTPNMSTITLGIITEDPNLTVAQQENNKKMNQVIDSLLKLNIPKQDIKTVDYRIELVYDYSDSTQTLRGYRVIHMLSITSNDINQTGIIVDTAVKNGANSVSTINFSVKNPEVYYNQALSLALTNAQAKAETLSKKMTVQLQKIPFKIQELNLSSPPIPYKTTMLAMSETATPIQPGELKISANIEAHFHYFL